MLETHLQLDWIYAKDSINTVESEIMEDEELINPPADVLDSLHELANVGMLPEILKQLDKLVESDSKYLPFAKQIQKLAKGFEDEQILALLEQYT